MLLFLLFAIAWRYWKYKRWEIQEKPSDFFPPFNIYLSNPRSNIITYLCLDYKEKKTKKTTCYSSVECISIISAFLSLLDLC